MKKAHSLVLAAALLPWFAAPAAAAQMAASCAQLLGISDSEASFIYYRAEEELGSATAGRLWNVYHRLRNHCAGQPRSVIDVSIEPRVKTFLEAYR